MRIVSHSQGSIVRDDMAEGCSLSIVVKQIKYYSKMLETTSFGVIETLYVFSSTAPAYLLKRT